MNKRIIKLFWIMLLMTLVIIPSCLFTVKINLWNLYGEMPSMSLLENPHSDLASELYSADGVLLGKYFRDNRSYITYEDLSPHLVHALIATEDHRFEEHSGIDLKSTVRAIVLSVIFRRNKGGGSTLTQQLAKNLFDTRNRLGIASKVGKLSNIPMIGLLTHKLKEWVLAVQLERAYTKKEIIAMYLNTVFFGSNTYGIKSAARAFFSTTPDMLTIGQAALLVGLLKAPATYSPINHPDRAITRRNIVLSQMCKNNFITLSEFEYVSELPLMLNYKEDTHNQGMAPYFRAVIGSFLLKWARKKGYDIYIDGLKIYTTIDSRMQQHAEDAVKVHMSNLQKKLDLELEKKNPFIQTRESISNEEEMETAEKIEVEEVVDYTSLVIKNTTFYKQLVQRYGEDIDTINVIMNTPVPTKLFSWEKGDIDAMISPLDAFLYNQKILHSGFMAMDPYTGSIKAWVGGINYKHFQYDHVQQSKRQPGSTFKAIVYTTALDNGFKFYDQITDAPVTFTLPNGGIWTPKNVRDSFSGKSFSLRYALTHSINSITAYLMKQLGPSLVVEYARRMGITSPLSPVPALCLGASAVSLYEMVGAFSVFLNKGVWTRPCYISHIEDKYGNVIERFISERREAINEDTSQQMLYILQGALDEGGGALKSIHPKLKIGNEIAGKTGTSNNQSDGWFMGLTQNLCVGVWVGAEYRCVHFKNFHDGQGAVTARPIWEKFMLKVYEDSNLPYSPGPLLKKRTPLSIKQQNAIEEVEGKKNEGICEKNQSNEEVAAVIAVDKVKNKKKITLDINEALY